MPYPKRFKYNPLNEKPKVVIQRVDVVPPPPMDEESLPESVSPTPTINLITEDEEEERTMEHVPRPIVDYAIKVEASEPSTSTAINNQSSSGPSSKRILPPLLPFSAAFGRPCGKNFSVLAVNGRSPPTPLSPSLEEDEIDYVKMCQEERRRRETWNQQISDKIPRIERKKDTEVVRMQRLQQEVAGLEAEMVRIRERSASIEGEMVVSKQNILRYDNELQSIRDFCQ